MPCNMTRPACLAVRGLLAVYRRGATVTLSRIGKLVGDGCAFGFLHFMANRLRKLPGFENSTVKTRQLTQPVRQNPKKLRTRAVSPRSSRATHPRPRESDPIAPVPPPRRGPNGTRRGGS